MFFNSVNYGLFLPIVFFLYWLVFNKNLKLQNILLLASSYFFYGCWSKEFLLLLAFSTFLDYYTGIRIENAVSKKNKLFWLVLSLVVNIGFLFTFKYYNFFVSSFSDLIATMGFAAHPSTLNIILPVGISFYTFHGISYIVDIYYGKSKATKNFIDYSLFVSFFPLLVAGPIERASHLLPQVQTERKFSYHMAVDGLRQILWGLFKKIAIADNCATIVNTQFEHIGDYSGSSMLLGAILFALQIYGDFSGYSDIALGSAKLLGFELLNNFSYPYFSRDIAEFWRRWHISLTTWFRDYVYIPLGGSKGSTFQKIRNTFIIFLVSGFWHGANWTFIFWGGLNALFFIPLLLFKKNRQNVEVVAKGRILPSFKELVAILSTFLLTVFAWIFFRATSLKHSFEYIGTMFKKMPTNIGQFVMYIKMSPLLFVSILVMFIFEWVQREKQFALSSLNTATPTLLRWLIYIILVSLIFLSGIESKEFIYFQF